LTQEVIDETALILSALQHDPGYAFLRDPAEDLYTEADVICPPTFPHKTC
jgi:hypothetical protein